MIEMRPSRAALAVSLLLAMLMACPVPAPARRMPPDERNTPIAIRALHDFAHCVAHSHWQRERARALLAMDYRTDAFRDAMRTLAAEHDRCLRPHQMLSFNILLFAGGLAEALLPRDRDLAALVAYDPARPPFQSRDEIEAMSLCTVRASSAEVGRLLATDAASEEESASLRALAPQLGQCLRFGTRTRVNPLEIRALLALAAWRLGDWNGRPLPAWPAAR